MLTVISGAGLSALRLKIVCKLSSVCVYGNCGNYSMSKRLLVTRLLQKINIVLINNTVN